MVVFVNSFDPERAKGYSRIFQYNIESSEKAAGGKFYVTVKDQKASLTEGECPNPDFVSTTDADTLIDMTNGEMTPMLAAISGKLKSTADKTEALIWMGCFPMKPEGGWA